MVGRHAVDAAVHLGNIERNNEHIEWGGPGATCRAVGRNLTGHKDELISLLRKTDILIDATQRRNPSEPVIPNDWIQYLPDHAIVVDLSVDPISPPQSHRSFAALREFQKATWINLCFTLRMMIGKTLWQKVSQPNTGGGRSPVIPGRVFILRLA